MSSRYCVLCEVESVMTNPGAAASYAIDYVSVYGVERVRAEMCESHRKAHQESGAAVRALGLVPS